MAISLPVSQPVEIIGPVGPLQAIVDTPVEMVTAPAAFAVICHPHPLQGGTMTNKVVHTLARACNECGVPSVRFNYRGVGSSAGSYDAGMGETDDAMAVIEWARLRWPATPLWLAGFSFGGGVALRAATRTATARLITVAPAAARDAPPMQLPDCPWLLLQGDADDVVPANMVLDWAQALAAPPQIKVLVGAGHFFHGRLIELREQVQNWLCTDTTDR
ncbi:MAG: alpha/beta hydrolase [Steroidobacteraceae bacterium]